MHHRSWMRWFNGLRKWGSGQRRTCSLFTVSITIRVSPERLAAIISDSSAHFRTEKNNVAEKRLGIDCSATGSHSFPETPLSLTQLVNKIERLRGGATRGPLTSLRPRAAAGGPGAKGSRGFRIRGVLAVQPPSPTEASSVGSGSRSAGIRSEAQASGKTWSFAGASGLCKSAASVESCLTRSACGIASPPPRC